MDRTISPACPWCNTTHNPDITCRRQPKTATEAMTVITGNYGRIYAKLALYLGRMAR